MKISLFLLALLTSCGDETYSDRGSKLNQEMIQTGAQDSADATAVEREDHEAEQQTEMIDEDSDQASINEPRIKAGNPAPQTSPTPLPKLPVEMDPAAEGDPNIVVFRIKAGTGTSPWNSKSEMLSLRRGQTLRLVNDDSVNHRLHTNGAPCQHGTNFAPGGQFDCELDANFDPGTKSPLYDHIAGVRAEFWIKVIP
jgi:hypothetical protein